VSVREHGVRGRDVLTVGIAAAALAYALLMLWLRGSSSLPLVTWAVAPVLLAAALALVLTGRAVRATVRGTAKRPVEPLAAYRVLRMAQACALAGAAVAGVYLAFVVAALPDVDAFSVRMAAMSAGAIALAGGVLSGAGLWTQSMCRLDPDGRSRDDLDPGDPLDPRDGLDGPDDPPLARP